MLDLLSRGADCELEVKLIERLDCWKARYPGQHYARPSPAGFELAAQHRLQEIDERRFRLGRFLGCGGILDRHAAKPKVRAQMRQPLVLEVHATTCGASKPS